jgi:hypothetical protein
MSVNKNAELIEDEWKMFPDDSIVCNVIEDVNLNTRQKKRNLSTMNAY